MSFAVDVNSFTRLASDVLISVGLKNEMTLSSFAGSVVFIIYYGKSGCAFWEPASC